MAGGGRIVSFRESNVVDAEQGRPRARTPSLDDEVHIRFFFAIIFALGVDVPSTCSFACPDSHCASMVLAMNSRGD